MDTWPSAKFMDRNQKPPDQTKCYICGGQKMTIEDGTGIGICPRCDQDTTNGTVWPNDYIEWHPGMQYPGERY